MPSTQKSEISVTLPTDTKNTLLEMAGKSGYKLSELCGIVLSLWTTHGGSVWMGRKKLAIDWPSEFVFLDREQETPQRK